MTTLNAKSIKVGIGATLACDNLNLSLRPGEIWSILGPNGVGKSTLLHSLAGLRALQCGYIEMNDINLDQLSRREKSQKIGILFQDINIQFPMTVEEVVMSSRYPWISPWGKSSQLDNEIVDEQLHHVGLSHFRHRNIQSLSGGERRRAELAGIAAQETDVIFLDEPVAHLDLNYQITLMYKMLTRWRKLGRTVIMVMHDINLAMRFSDKMLLLFGDGKTCQGSIKDVANQENFSRLYDYPLERYTSNKVDLFWPV